ncbi:hypothetical protein [Fusibacter ferrireducens]|uniref:Uncharacterized protein n=1 Tax=Fusibacter ferrireducens TaxID=2785058 RepID=A0ABR9ZN98_9FIRM|nr:hypothetical protein [Fusibacter ferrireducens]MBF4691940.1 hypothetical protein [Fusibacter ferrireducens]
MVIFNVILFLLVVFAPIYAFVMIIERFNRIELHMNNLETKLDQLLDVRHIDNSL